MSVIWRFIGWVLTRNGNDDPFGLRRMDGGSGYERRNDA